MSKNRTALNRLLGVMGVGAGMVAMVLFSAHSRNQATDKVLEKAYTLQTRLVCDTIYLTDTRDIPTLQSMGSGYYCEKNDIAVKYHFVDSTDTRVGRAFVRDVNDDGVFTDYHEVKHALNCRLLNFIDGVCTPSVMAADELSARVAERLAELSGNPPLPLGSVGVGVSYSLPQGYTLQKLADDAFENMLNYMGSVDAEYISEYIEFAETRNKKDQNCPLITADEMINKFMTFKINGRHENLLKLASDTTQNRVYEYLNMHNNIR